jgi:hypothetical protein
MFKKKTLVLALACLVATPALAAVDNDALMQEMRRLAERVEQLEAANKQLQAAIVLSSDAQTKELAARLDDVENEVVSLRRPSALEEAVDGILAGASLVMVAQKANGGDDATQLTVRADIEVELPMGRIGDAEGRLFGHLRAGDGEGVDTGAFATSNATAFGDELRLDLMQAWYQLDIPVGGRSGGLGRFEVTVGKIDPFAFFDGNSVADDESEQFLNLAFVHNPLLDAGGDIGVGDDGGSPGLHLAYVSDVNGGDHFTASLGVFGAGEDGANFADSFDGSLAIGQLEYAGRTFGSLAGAYRLYGWSNSNAVDFANEAERHSGWGVSVDQQVADHVTLFTRIGLSTDGYVAFDRAYTLGAQFDGGLWGREGDRVGLAAGWLQTSNEYERETGNSGTETPVELYYVWQFNDHAHLSPSVQWIGKPGGDMSADAVTVWGLRAKASF